MSHEEGAEDCRLTADEKELLLSIKSVPVTVPAPRLRRALGSLVDVLCAYCYDVRITQHDPSPESAWTIAILSPTLSWLAPSEDLQRVLVHFARRVLIYPYLRRYDLARLCIKDCAVILKLGKRRVLKCLLEVEEEGEVNGRLRRSSSTRSASTFSTRCTSTSSFCGCRSGRLERLRGRRWITPCCLTWRRKSPWEWSWWITYSTCSPRQLRESRSIWASRNWTNRGRRFTGKSRR